MIGDGHVLVSAFPRGQCHLFDRAATVGFNSVHVDVALDITFFDELWKSMLLSSLNLPAILAQLRDDVIKAEFGIDFFFRSACDALIGVKAAESVFTQRKSHLEGALA